MRRGSVSPKDAAVRTAVRRQKCAASTAADTVVNEGQRYLALQPREPGVSPLPSFALQQPFAQKAAAAPSSNTRRNSASPNCLPASSIMHKCVPDVQAAVRIIALRFLSYSLTASSTVHSQRPADSASVLKASAEPEGRVRPAGSLRRGHRRRFDTLIDAHPHHLTLQRPLRFRFYQKMRGLRIPCVAHSAQRGTSPGFA